MACRPVVCSASALTPLRHRLLPLVCVARCSPSSARLAGNPAAATTSLCRRCDHIVLLLAVSCAPHLLPRLPPNSLAVVGLLPPVAVLCRFLCHHAPQAEGEDEGERRRRKKVGVRED
ncbi:hypothetical protein [Oryza sativa Japonica Group]|uniref:Uncharacterized protein P0702F03.14 n=1 Tax=Oryza sativa subsp. japonica TaxID=39947 RepID=Q5NAY0_ORYSJ|nr:hypothetical protein [Oryza sativa Japonica Group]